MLSAGRTYLQQLCPRCCSLHPCTCPITTAAPGSFLQQFYEATSGMDPAARGKYLEEPPEGAPDIEAAHQVGLP